MRSTVALALLLASSLIAGCSTTATSSSSATAGTANDVTGSGGVQDVTCTSAAVLPGQGIVLPAAGAIGVEVGGQTVSVNSIDANGTPLLVMPYLGNKTQPVRLHLANGTVANFDYQPVTASGQPGDALKAWLSQLESAQSAPAKSALGASHADAQAHLHDVAASVRKLVQKAQAGSAPLGKTPDGPVLPGTYVALDVATLAVLDAMVTGAQAPFVSVSCGKPGVIKGALFGLTFGQTAVGLIGCIATTHVLFAAGIAIPVVGEAILAMIILEKVILPMVEAAISANDATSSVADIQSPSKIQNALDSVAAKLVGVKDTLASMLQTTTDDTGAVPDSATVDAEIVKLGQLQALAADFVPNTGVTAGASCSNPGEGACVANKLFSCVDKHWSPENDCGKGTCDCTKRTNGTSCSCTDGHTSVAKACAGWNASLAAGQKLPCGDGAPLVDNCVERLTSLATKQVQCKMQFEDLLSCWAGIPTLACDPKGGLADPCGMKQLGSCWETHPSETICDFICWSTTDDPCACSSQGAANDYVACGGVHHTVKCDGKTCTCLADGATTVTFAQPTNCGQEESVIRKTCGVPY